MVAIGELPGEGLPGVAMGPADDGMYSNFEDKFRNSAEWAFRETLLGIL